MLYLEMLKIPNYDNIVKDTVLIPVCFGSSLVESHQKDFFIQTIGIKMLACNKVNGLRVILFLFLFSVSRLRNNEFYF